jgi:hypothetical protein
MFTFSQAEAQPAEPMLVVSSVGQQLRQLLFLLAK